MMNRRQTILGLAALAAPTSLWAAPARYLLDRETSTVGFTYTLNGNKSNGRMPVRAAEIMLDVDRPSNSKVSAEVDVRKADAGVFFATDAMLSESVLNAKRFPTIKFQSLSISGNIHKAVVEGRLTIRDVTETVRFDAQLFRQRGTEGGDRRKLSILMSGEIDRRRFGADGFSNLVGPMIGLDILTRVTLA